MIVEGNVLEWCPKMGGDHHDRDNPAGAQEGGLGPWPDSSQKKEKPGHQRLRRALRISKKKKTPPRQDGGGRKGGATGGPGKKGDGGGEGEMSSKQ